MPRPLKASFHRTFRIFLNPRVTSLTQLTQEGDGELREARAARAGRRRRGTHHMQAARLPREGHPAHGTRGEGESFRCF